MVIIKNSGNKLAINLLTDIVAAICERETQLDLILLANYIDHYRAYLASLAETTHLESHEIDFHAFITDQALIDLATAFIVEEANETIAPLKAL